MILLSLSCTNVLRHSNINEAKRITKRKLYWGILRYPAKNSLSVLYIPGELTLAANRSVKTSLPNLKYCLKPARSLLQRCEPILYETRSSVPCDAPEN